MKPFSPFLFDPVISCKVPLKEKRLLDTVFGRLEIFIDNDSFVSRCRIYFRMSYSMGSVLIKRAPPLQVRKS